MAYTEPIARTPNLPAFPPIMGPPRVASPTAARHSQYVNAANGALRGRMMVERQHMGMPFGPMMA